MVVTHRFAPVGKRESRICLLRLSKCFGGLVELETVKKFYSFDKWRLRRWCSRGREIDRSEFRLCENPSSEPDTDDNDSAQAVCRNLHNCLRDIREGYTSLHPLSNGTRDWVLAVLPIQQIGVDCSKNSSCPDMVV